MAEPTEEAIARLLLRRSALDADEVALFTRVFPHLVKQHLATVWRGFSGKGLSEADMHDLSQETFATFFVQTCAEGFPDSIKAKLRSLAAGKALNHRRDAQREVPGVPSSGSVPAASIPSLARLLDEHAFRRQVLLALTPDQMAVFDAVDLRQLSIREAAAELDIQPSTLHSRLTSARKVIAALAESFFPPSQR